MAGARVVKVKAELVDVDTGLWCNDCMLSTGARVWFTTSTGGRTTLRSAVFCTEGGTEHQQIDA